MNKSTLQRLADVAHRRMVAFLIDPRAVSTVEYALIVVAVVGIVGVGAATLGGTFNNMFETLGSRIQNGMKVAS